MISQAYSILVMTKNAHFYSHAVSFNGRLSIFAIDSAKRAVNEPRRELAPLLSAVCVLYRLLLELNRPEAQPGGARGFFFSA